MLAVIQQIQQQMQERRASRQAGFVVVGRRGDDACALTSSSAPPRPPVLGEIRIGCLRSKYVWANNTTESCFEMRLRRAPIQHSKTQPQRQVSGHSGKPGNPAPDSQLNQTGMWRGKWRSEAGGFFSSILGSLLTSVLRQGCRGAG